ECQKDGDVCSQKTTQVQRQNSQREKPYGCRVWEIAFQWGSSFSL
ncbi:hypothetical protein DBR06_SOUSAS9610097, partial [Sousa chinensis]